MFSLPKSVYEYISKQNRNLPLVGLITFGFPKIFVRSIYQRNKNRDLWNGKKACFTLSFDCDYPEDVIALPDIVKMMSKYSYKASFAAVGHWVEKYPKEHESVLNGGHELMNHTYSHPDNELINPGRKFKDISREEKMEEITRCHDICKNLLGYEPIGLRIPHFKNLFTDEIYGILKELNYKYSSSTWLTNTTTAGLPFIEKHGIAEFPLSTCPKHPFTVFDTWHSLNAERLSHKLLHRGPESYVDLFRTLIEYGKKTGSYINIYIDPLDVPNIPQFEEMLSILDDDELEVVTYEEYMNREMHFEHVE
ncbi:MAG: polysaccharide deacetylase family protein [Gammaproteobacteria bacterium]|nr:polysaccharide deacetylase family protein [Gammaproteobacteria bacterium]